MTQTIPHGSQESNSQTANLINRLFKELKGCKPAWGAAFKEGSELEKESKRQYVKAFLENDIRDWSYVEKGLSEARKDGGDFFPSTGKFLEWCLGKEEEKHWEHIRYEKELAENIRLARLPKPPRDKSKGLEELRKIREMIK